MKKEKKKKKIHIYKSKDKEDDEYVSLKKNKKLKNNKTKKKIDIDNTIFKYKKFIKITCYIIGIFFIFIVILLFWRHSNDENLIQINNNKILIKKKENDENNEINNEINNENKNNNVSVHNNINKENKENKEYNTNIGKNKFHDNKDKINNIQNNDNIENNNKANNYENNNENKYLMQNNNQTGIKRKIYVKYMDFWPAFKLDKFDVHKILKEKYEVILSENPDYVIFGEFGGENYGIENKFDCVKLFLTIENRGPDFENTDYAIGIHYINNGDRYFRKPTETHQLTAIGSVYNVTQVKGQDIKKKKFCAWVVSNGSAKARNLFYDKLSEYKIVDSGGGFKNNVGGPVKDKLKFLGDYKFSICFENSKTDGYISEKLSDAFEAGTIPIYYGDDTVLELLNNKSYIHVKDKSEFDAKIELIKEIDQNFTLYEEMIREKIVLDDSRYPREVQKYKDFIYHIIDQDKQKAKRFKRKNENNLKLVKMKYIN